MYMFPQAVCFTINIFCYDFTFNSFILSYLFPGYHWHDSSLWRSLLQNVSVLYSVEQL